MALFRDDIVRDILDRVIRAAASDGGFDNILAEQIERQVRQDWGGSRPYVAHDVESRRIARDEKIAAAWDAGQRDIRTLAIRYGISERQVRRIVNG